jgi:hypothetical protein
MTVFGWDASHYDEPPAARDGIDFYLHKITDGNRYYEDPAYLAALDAARGLGIPILGSYHVLHGGVPAADQVGWWVERVTALTPWWRDHPLWIWQIDAERFTYLTAPTIDEVNAAGDEVCRRTGCPAGRVLAYAPPWLYGDQLTGLRYRLWSSNYAGNPSGGYRDVYPGDSSAQWHAPVEPLILQYSSRATIAGQSTCDADAFRGDLDALTRLLDGGDMTTLDDTFTMADGRVVKFASAIRDTYVSVGRLEAAVAALQAAITAAGAASPDTVAILAGVDTRLADLRTTVRADTRDAVADLGEGGAAKLRAT